MYLIISSSHFFALESGLSRLDADDAHVSKK